MLFGKDKDNKKLREECKELLVLADKVHCYRQDVMNEQECEELVSATRELEGYVKDKGSSERELKEGKARLEKIMKVTGGTFYPVKFLPDNLEVILVAAILAIGIRTFFIQPFSIPTNSMYPTYNGMTSQVYASDEAEPGGVSRVFRKIFKGASHYEVTTKSGGELMVPLFTPRDRMAAVGNMAFRQHRGTKWLVFPEPQRMYTFYVGQEAHNVAVPWDFGMEDVLVKQHFSQYEDFGDFIRAMHEQGRLVMSDEGIVVKTGIELKPGEDVFNFDIMAGDMLFVDRLTYHFRNPKVGEPIVFRTDSIDYLRKADGSPDERYFIKRLVGLGGDEVSVDPPMLYRNGEPIEGADAFERNFNKEGEYKGYSADRRVADGKVDVVPEGHFYPMGDNSYHSEDGRYFGPVREDALVGKALFIFYPFTKRWGVSE